ncbi:MAG: hypothetical protein ABIV04_02165 [Massilia sp.]
MMQFPIDVIKIDQSFVRNGSSKRTMASSLARLLAWGRIQASVSLPKAWKIRTNWISSASAA